MAETDEEEDEYDQVISLHAGREPLSSKTSSLEFTTLIIDIAMGKKTPAYISLLIKKSFFFQPDLMRESFHQQFEGVTSPRMQIADRQDADFQLVGLRAVW